jgi:steroid 5-alpha reductase family enzyme
MSLPVLKSIEECGDYAKAVEPFIHQLYELPARVLASIASPAELKYVYATTNPLISGFAISILLGGVFVVASEINRNYSQVDRFWSILPNLYIIHYAIWARVAGLPHSRIDLVAVFSTLWSVSFEKPHLYRRLILTN